MAVKKYLLVCPSREKGQYTGDMTITGASHLLLTGDPSLLKKAIENQVQSLQFTPGLRGRSRFFYAGNCGLFAPVSIVCLALLSLYGRSRFFKNNG